MGAMEDAFMSLYPAEVPILPKLCFLQAPIPKVPGIIQPGDGVIRIAPEVTTG